MGRYAQETSVPMERSRREVERTLVRYGASGFAYSWERRTEPYPHPTDCRVCKGTRLDRSDSTGRRRCNAFPWNAPDTIERETVIVGFKMPTPRGERRVQLEVPMPHELEVGTKAKVDAATRQRWRVLVLVLKAKLEAVASGISTLEAEFLANVVMHDGRTIGQAILPRMNEAVESGRLLPGKGETG